ncbi:MAG: hypothetical protein ABID45_01045 [Patescibacteria group bacterium]
MGKINVPIIKCDPSNDAETILALAKGADALIMEAFGTGQTPLDLADAFKEIIEGGTPIFTLKEGGGTEHGIVKRDDWELNPAAVKVGVIPIEKINYNNWRELFDAISEEIEAGKTGTELGEAIRERFSYGPDETKPIPEWGKPGSPEARKKRMGRK